MIQREEFGQFGTSGECYILNSEPEVRLSKMQTPKAHLKEKNLAFIAKQAPSNVGDKMLDTKEELAIENIDSEGVGAERLSAISEREEKADLAISDIRTYD